MNQMKVSAPVTAIVLVVVVVILLLVGYRYLNPPQKLGPEAQAMNQAWLRAHPEQR